MAKDYVPRAQGKFNEFQINIAKMVVAHGARWGLSNQVINDFKAESDKHGNAYKAISNKKTRTSSQVFTHQLNRKTFEQTLRNFVNEYLASNSKISVGEKI